MALWKITIRNSGTTNGCRVEKGMFVEYATKNVSNPMSSVSTHREAIGRLFFNKYGIDLVKAQLVTPSRMECEKID